MAALAALTALVACDSGGGVACLPGESEPCTDDAGCVGTRACLDDNSGFGECLCGADMSMSSAPADASQPPDATFVPDAAVQHDLSCWHCSTKSNGAPVDDPSALCPESRALWEAVYACVCHVSCITSCTNVCNGGGGTPTCGMCTVHNCQAQSAACAADK